MKKTYYAYLTLACMAIYIVCTSSSLGRATDDNVGNTGAPGENTQCSNCHAGGAYGTVSLSIQAFNVGSSVPVTYYVPNQVYDMKVTVNNSMGSPLGFGFQLTAMRNTNTPYAAYSNLGSNVKQKALVSGAQAGRTYLEHNGVLNNNQFNFRWTAPGVDQGNVTFYSTGVACNTNGGTGGDKAGNSSLILPPAPALSVQSNFEQPLCAGDSNGWIELSILSGVEPYTFAWSDGSTSPNRQNLVAGSYDVIITDGLGQSYQESFELTAPNALTSFVDVLDPTQFNGNGTVNVAVSGGTAPYVLTFNNEVVSSPIVYPSGTYLLEIQDANNCSIVEAVIIEEPAPYSVAATLTEPSCNGNSDGSISLAIAGAFAPYTVMWDNGLEGADANGFEAGNHIASITDQFGNETNFAIQLTEPDSVNITYTYVPIACNGDATTIEISATGGTGSYNGVGTFFVNAGVQTIQVTDGNGCVATQTFEIETPSPLVGEDVNGTISCFEGSLEVTITATGGTAPYIGDGPQTIEAPGNYLFSVTDSQGCQTDVSAFIAATDGPSLSSEIMQSTCYNACNGQITLTLDNPELPGNFIWSDQVEGPYRENLCPGTYSCVYTGLDGCNVSNQFVITEPDSLLILNNAPEAICAGDIFNTILSVSGGTAPYSIYWNDTLGTVQQFLSAGEHAIEVVDSQSCSSHLLLQISAFPETEVMDILLNEPSCNEEANGSIVILATNAAGPLAYEWIPGVSNSALAESVSAGAYALTITDINGCPVQLAIILGQPTPLEITVEVNDSFAGNGTIEASPSGGTAPYTFEWSNGSTSNVIEVPTGFYSLTVTDSAGCITGAAGFEIVAGIDESLALSASVFPNPFEAKLEVRSTSRFTIYNAAGQAIHSGFGASILDTSAWSSGLYYYIDATGKSIKINKN
jgi:hypothetical protein